MAGMPAETEAARGPPEGDLTISHFVPGNWTCPVYLSAPSGRRHRSSKSRENAYHLPPPPPKAGFRYRESAPTPGSLDFVDLARRRTQCFPTFPRLQFGTSGFQIGHAPPHAALKLRPQRRQPPGGLCAVRLRGAHSRLACRTGAAGGVCTRTRLRARARCHLGRERGHALSGPGSLGPLSGDGGDGESRGRRDGRQAPYLP